MSARAVKASSLRLGRVVETRGASFLPLEGSGADRQKRI
jgi:hypothetical protein